MTCGTSTSIGDSSLTQKMPKLENFYHGVSNLTFIHAILGYLITLYQYLLLITLISSDLSPLVLPSILISLSFKNTWHPSSRKFGSIFRAC